MSKTCWVVVREPRSCFYFPFSEICKYRHLHILHSLIKYVPNFVFWILPYTLTKCNEQTEGSATGPLCPHRPRPVVFPVQDVIMHSRFYFINRLLINVRQSIMRSCVCFRCPDVGQDRVVASAYQPRGFRFDSHTAHTDAWNLFISNVSVYYYIYMSTFKYVSLYVLYIYENT